MFQWTTAQKEEGVWAVTFAPDRPGIFLLVVTADDFKIAEWTVSVSPGIPRCCNFSL